MKTLDYYRAVLSAVIIAVFLTSMFYVFTRDDVKESQISKTNTKVVGTYKECEIVRYSPPNGAVYHYFLDCPNK